MHEVYVRADVDRTGCLVRRYTDWAHTDPESACRLPGIVSQYGFRVCPRPILESPPPRSLVIRGRHLSESRQVRKAAGRFAMRLGAAVDLRRMSTAFLAFPIPVPEGDSEVANSVVEQAVLARLQHDHLIPTCATVTPKTLVACMNRGDGGPEIVTKRIMFVTVGERDDAAVGTHQWRAERIQAAFGVDWILGLSRHGAYVRTAPPRPFLLESCMFASSL